MMEDSEVAKMEERFFELVGMAEQRQAEDDLLRAVGRDRLVELAQAEQDGRLVVLPDWKPGDPPIPGMVIDYDLKGEPGTKGVACYCPPNCPNKDCVGGQCFVGHGTKAKRREEPT